MDHYCVVYPCDPNGFIINFFSEHAPDTSLIHVPDWKASAPTHGIIFDDGEEFSAEVDAEHALPDWYSPKRPATDLTRKECGKFWRRSEDEFLIDMTFPKLFWYPASKRRLVLCALKIQQSNFARWITAP